MNKKVIISGAAGFIGFHTSLFFLKKGYEILGIDNINDSYDVNIKKKRISHLMSYKNFIYKKTDISNYISLEKIFSNFCKVKTPQLVINLAAKTGVRKSSSDPNSYYESNVIGCLNIARLVNLYKIKNLIHASTSSVYGNSTKKSFDIGDETDKPYSNYAASKKSSEVLLYAFHKLNKINITILRFFTVYGPYGRPDMSPFIFIESNLRKNKINLFGTGNQQRDFTYVDDIVSGIYKCRRLKNYNILNLGNNKPVKINLLLEKIEKFSNFENLVHKLPALIEDVKYTSANINKTKSLIKWEPITKFEKGIKKTFDWHIENRKWLRKIKI